MNLIEKIKKMIQDAIEYNNTGSVSKGNTKAVVGGAVYDYVQPFINKVIDLGIAEETSF